MLVTQRKAKALLGDSLVLRIDPRRLTRKVNCQKPIAKRIEDWLTPAPRAMCKSLTLPIRIFHPFAVGERWFPVSSPLESIDKYAKVQDLLEHRDDYRQSRWFGHLRDELRSCGVTRHKGIVMQSETEIADFFEEYLGELIRSMASTGYRDDRGADIGTALIGCDGALYKGTSGTHRFYAARLLGVSPVPLRIICVHRGWLSSLGLPASAAGIARLGEALRQVERCHR